MQGRGCCHGQSVLMVDGFIWHRGCCILYITFSYSVPVDGGISGPAYSSISVGRGLKPWDCCSYTSLRVFPVTIKPCFYTNVHIFRNLRFHPSSIIPFCKINIKIRTRQPMSVLSMCNLHDKIWICTIVLVFNIYFGIYAALFMVLSKHMSPTIFVNISE